MPACRALVNYLITSSSVCGTAGAIHGYMAGGGSGGDGCWQRMASHALFGALAGPWAPVALPALAAGVFIPTGLERCPTWNTSVCLSSPISVPREGDVGLIGR